MLRWRFASLLALTIGIGVSSTTPAWPQAFRRGDANVDGRMDLSDSVAVLSHLFLGGPIACRDAGDLDDSGSLEITDAIFVLNFLFSSGEPPRPPGHLECGVDPTPDDLGCERTDECEEPSPCDVPLAELGFEGPNVDSVGPPGGVTVSVNGRTLFGHDVGQLLQGGLQLALKSLPDRAGGESVGEFLIGVFWPSEDPLEGLWAEIESEIEMRLDERFLEDTLEVSALFLEGLRDQARFYRQVISSDASDESKRAAWSDTATVLRTLVPQFRNPSYAEDLAPYFAEVATLELAILRDGALSLGEWGDPALAEVVSGELAEKITAHQRHLREVYLRGLIREGNAAARDIRDQWDLVQEVGNVRNLRTDYPVQIWSALNRYRRRMTLEVLDTAALWTGLMPGAEPPAIDREIYADPVGYFPHYLPYRRGDTGLVENRALRFHFVGVDGSLLADVAEALANERLIENGVRVDTVLPLFDTLGGGTSRSWNLLPALTGWSSGVLSTTRSVPTDRLQELRFELGEHPSPFIALRLNPAIYRNDTRLPAEDPVLRQIYPFFAPLEARFAQTLPVTLCNPITRVVVTNDEYVELQIDTRTGLWYDYQALSVNRYWLELRDGTEMVWLAPVSTAGYPHPERINSVQVRDPSHRSEFAYTGHVLSNLVTHDVAALPTAPYELQLVILGFRRADSY